MIYIRKKTKIFIAHKEISVYTLVSCKFHVFLFIAFAISLQNMPAIAYKYKRFITCFSVDKITLICSFRRIINHIYNNNISILALHLCWKYACCVSLCLISSTK